MAPKSRSRGKAARKPCPRAKGAARFSDRAKKVEEQKWIRGFKITRADGRSFRGNPSVLFEVGQTYRVEGDVVVCKNGLHFSPTALEAWASCPVHYMRQAGYAVFEVKAEESKTKSTPAGRLGGDNVVKSAASELHVERKLDRAEMDKLLTGWTHPLTSRHNHYVFQGVELATVNAVDDRAFVRYGSRVGVGPAIHEQRFTTSGESTALRKAVNHVEAYVARFEKVLGENKNKESVFVYKPQTLRWVFVRHGAVLASFRPQIDHEDSSFFVVHSTAWNRDLPHDLEEADEIVKNAFKSVGSTTSAAQHIREQNALARKALVEARERVNQICEDTMDAK